MANPNTLGKFLREERFRKGLTLVQVSKETEVAQSDLSSLELGKRWCPSPTTVIRLSAFYGISALELGEMIDLPNYKMEIFLKSLRGEKWQIN